MKATGIVRRIDDLGRVVIPKEIRRTMRIREGDPLDNKYFYTTHSELNAILNYRGGSLEGSKLYVSLFPCNECAKAIIQSGIREIIYDSDKYEHTPSVIIAANSSARIFFIINLRLSVLIFGQRPQQRGSFKAISPSISYYHSLRDISIA